MSVLEAGVAVAGWVVAFFAAWAAYRLGLRAQRKREYWIRLLNSYQDYYFHTAHLIDYVLADLDPDAETVRDSMRGARKAAYDAEFYSGIGDEAATELQRLTERLGGVLGALSAGQTLSTVTRQDLATMRSTVENRVRLFRRAEGVSMREVETMRK